ncbi:MAG: GHKL domain-containing protein [Bacteroidales bacterium]|nr:GHKL domain-containing protein [Bacteroidales bacterium]
MTIPDLSTVFFFPLEFVFAMLVFVWKLKKRNYFIIRTFLTFILFILAYGVAQLAFTILLNNNIPLVYFWHGVVIFIIFVVMIAEVMLLFKVRFVEAVFCVTCAYLTEHMVYAIRSLADWIIGSEVFVAGTIWYFIIHIVCYLIAYFTLANKMIIDGHYETSVLQSLSLSLSALFMVLVMSLIAFGLGIVWLHSIYAIFSCFFVLYSQVNQLNQLNLQKQLSHSEQLWVKHKAQYETSKTNIDIINRKCHDLKNKVSALKQIEDTQERERAIQFMEEAIIIYDSIIKTGNEILDTVITEKRLICNEYRILMNCMIDGHLLDYIDTIDLYSLFGNLLDHAIEGIRMQAEDKPRGISLLVFDKMNLIMIQIENNYSPMNELNEDRQIFDQYEKQYRKNRLDNVQEIVEKYDGIMKIETESEVFLVRITLPKW